MTNRLHREKEVKRMSGVSKITALYERLSRDDDLLVKDPSIVSRNERR